MFHAIKEYALVLSIGNCSSLEHFFHFSHYFPLFLKIIGADLRVLFQGSVPVLEAVILSLFFS